MDVIDKEKRLKKMLNKMTEDKLTEACFDAFIKGMDQGIKIQSIISNCQDEKESA